jgi:hypothetical protein
MKHLALLALLFLAAVQFEAATAAQKTEPPYSIAVRLDRSAIWVGDPLTYTVEIVHARNIQFALDSLKKENLTLSPFVVRDVRVDERPWRDDKKILEVVLHLTTYETGKPELQIPPLALYYFRRQDGVPDKDARAQPIKLPPQRVAVRSTLPAGQARLREFKPLKTVNPGLAIGAFVLGLLGIGTIGSYALLGIWRAARRERTVKRPSGRRARARRTREALRGIRDMAHQSPAEMAAVFAESGRFLREFVTESQAVETRGLTPGEAEQALRKAGLNGAFADQVRTVLERCEDGLYRKADGSAPNEGQYKSVVEALERAVKLAPRAK